MVRSTMNALALALLCGGTLVAQSGATYAQNEGKPLTVMVAQPVGSAIDVISRLLASNAGEELKQPVVIDNKPGGGGVIALQALKSAKPDGNTVLVVANGSLTISPWTRKLPYDTGKDFSPVSVLFGFSQFLTVPKTSPANSLKELLALGQKKPESLSFSSLGVGSTTHFLGLLVARAAGVQMAHVPYTSTAQYMLDIEASRVDFSFASLQSTQNFEAEGKFKYLATTGASRSSLRPAVPTTAEEGYGEMNLSVWFVLLAPAGTPADTIDRIQKAFAHAGKDERNQKRLAADGVDNIVSTPAVARQMLDDESAKMKTLIDEMKIRID